MKYWKISNTEYPTYTIDLAKLDSFNQICDIFAELKITKYVYDFTYNSIVIKYGISADLSCTWGERVYRQAGHLEGWEKRLSGSSGSDMRIINEDYFDQYGSKLNRDRMYLTIRDLTNAVNDHSTDRAWPCKKLERELIKEHIIRHGKAPIGNKDDEKKIDGRGYVSKKTISSLFEGLLDA
jgi:hypothetical protein